MAGGGEGRIVVGVHVVHRECDELTAAPPDGPEEEAGVQRVGEGGREHHDVVEIVTGFVEAKHGPHARWAVEVAIAGGEELAGELERGPPPRDHPHAESVLHEHAGGVEFLRVRARRPVRDSGELHLASVALCFERGEEEEIRRWIWLWLVWRGERKRDV